MFLQRFGYAPVNFLSYMVRKIKNKNKLIKWLIYIGLFVLNTWGSAFAQEKVYEFEELGQPIKIPLAIEFVTRDEVTGPIAWGAFTDAERNALVGVHMEDGRLIEVDLAEYGKANALLLFKTSERYIYLYSGKPGQFFKYDVRSNKLETIGEASKALYWMKSSYAVSARGLIYIGTYPRAAVSILDPNSEEVTVIDRVSPSKGSEYVINIETAEDGIVYFATGMQHGELWAYNPETEEKKQILPKNLKTYGAPKIWRAVDGRVYGQKGKTMFLCSEAAIEVVEKTKAAIPVELDNLNEEMRALYLNREGDLVVENKNTKKESVIKSTFEPAAREVLTIGDEYKGKLYGSGMKPGNIFTYDMQTGEIDDLGVLTRGRVQAYDILAHQDRLFMTSYTGGFIDVFDIDENGRPYNVKPVAHLHSLAKQERLLELQPAPDGFIYIPTVPIKGYLGGTLVRLDPETLEVEVFKDIVPNQSLMSVTVVPETGELLLTSSVQGGTSAKPTEKESVIVLWDPVRKEVTYQGKPIEDVRIYEGAVRGNNGLIYGTGGNILYVFDPIKKEMITTQIVDNPSGNAMRIRLSSTLGADGMIYGIDTRNGRLLRVDPKSNAVSILAEHGSLVGARTAKVKEDGYLYYATHSRLFRVGITN